MEAALPEAASILLPEMEDGMDAAAFQRSEDAQLHKAIDILRKEVQGQAPDGK